MRYGIFLGLIFGPGIFLGCVGGPRDFFGFDFIPIRSSSSLEIRTTPPGQEPPWWVLTSLLQMQLSK